ncbi:proline dehydrogenase family protein [Leptospira meyeri]|uniref:proline dehydrogenase family protein n=1 Tax=Leptospira meyeri TaxID=29508 RepID=UPI0002BD3953|nr:proline dehydrogenase family protein [Leptospira meyeri]EMJ88224.1 proline dehydrogenase family protein [Leptospira meyeri serovar Semaranga str. Veldrot Semarang 173]
MFTKQLQDEDEEILKIAKKINSTSGSFLRQFLFFITSTIIHFGFRYPKLKLQTFKFIDVLPSLETKNIYPYFKIYIFDEDTELPTFIKNSIHFLIHLFHLNSIVSYVLLNVVKFFAKLFILCESSKKLNIKSNQFRPRTYDILGEIALSPAEAKEIQKQYLELIETLPEEIHNIDPKLRTNISIKCSGIETKLYPESEESSVQYLKEALRPILRSAMGKKIGINLDMEQYDLKSIISRTAKELFLEEEFKGYPHFGIVVQSYLKSSKEELFSWKEYAMTRGVPITIRLVKGAYLEYERIKSEERGWDPPVFNSKHETDIKFEENVLFLLESFPYLRSAFGTHNLRSLSFVLYHTNKITITDFEIQMLFGMAGKYKLRLESLGYTVREYSPIGSLLPGMAYLIRRLLENTSNQGFLYQLSQGKKIDSLVKNPNKETQYGI